MVSTIAKLALIAFQIAWAILERAHQTGDIDAGGRRVLGELYIRMMGLIDESAAIRASVGRLSPADLAGVLDKLGAEGDKDRGGSSGA